MQTLTSSVIINGEWHVQMNSLILMPDLHAQRLAGGDYEAKVDKE